MTGSRIANFAAPGELFKRPRERRPSGNIMKAPRQQDRAHLAAIRQCPCVACGTDPCGTAAHVRMSSAAHGKRATGLSEKPDDMWTTPLCHTDHMKQHREGELSFWHHVGVYPVKLAQDLYRVSPNVEAMRAIVYASRER